MNKPPKLHAKFHQALASLAILAVCFCAVPSARAAIPESERQVLLDFYISTNGNGWTDNTGWNGPVGTECGWKGIQCDPAGTHVWVISVFQNGLTGTLPVSLQALTGLVIFDVSTNNLTGSIPPLQGLTNLRRFYVDNNHLTGSIPPLQGLTNLQEFYVGANQLTGSIPPLQGLTRLTSLSASSNQLTGLIPSLQGLTNLLGFYIDDNRLTGSIPSFKGLLNLLEFDVSSNQLTGSIPLLEGLNLQSFDVSTNQLTGSVPSLQGLSDLKYFKIGNNQLRGAVPAVPSPNALLPGNSSLCLNYLDPTPNLDWDAATGETPWYQNCRPLPDSIFANGFETSP